jgi:DtxR family Mn-dependent transcriptional regulator
LEDHKGHLKDEFLEALYKADEEDRLPVEEAESNLTNPLDPAEIDSLVVNGLVNRDNGKISLTNRGRTFAEALVRSHRLAERLFSEILDPTCPHGKKIPPGRCCKASRRQVMPIVIPLTELPVSSDAKIVFITTPHHRRFGRLVNLGVVPGGKITLLQKKPSYLMKIGSTEVAIDSDIASEIYVRRIGNEAPAA